MENLRINSDIQIQLEEGLKEIKMNKIQKYSKGCFSKD